VGVCAQVTVETIFEYPEGIPVLFWKALTLYQYVVFDASVYTVVVNAVNPSAYTTGVE
jgi:hypothetical protein